MSVRVCACEVHRAVERDDGLACAGRPCDAGGAVVLALDGGALSRVQEDRPLLPGVVERALQFSSVVHEPEPPLSVRVLEGVRVIGGLDRRSRGSTHSELEERLGSLARQVAGECEERVLSRSAGIGEPFGGHAVAE